MNFGSIAFSDASKKLQEKAGSRANYALMEKFHNSDSFTLHEVEFIAQRDGFYISSIGKNGYPYIQFRGGPKGFLKVTDNKRLSFVDFVGNKQFISTGNIETNNKVSLFLMDYANRTRLKIFAEAELLEIQDNPDLFKKIAPENYQFRPERIITLHLKAFDWNCPQHITPRYTLEEIEEAFNSHQH